MGATVVIPIIANDFRIQGASTPILATPSVAGMAYLGVGFGSL
jgi:hypothetical protein